ncbi:MAG: Co2+/Mg2+ efflux protein ApaG [Deltaproteobacteria bacterium]|nr:Co2+/Mg2+ efflux protein ApaG [Deltaproteobacteria bacterium]
MSELGSIHTTENIQIIVEPQYLPEESQPVDSFWVFTYEVVMTNMGQEPVQLLSRHWVITDANGNQENVRGPGVVGKQPILQEGDSFSYTSFCPLPTQMGTMHGTYQFRRDDGEVFDAKIAPFVLSTSTSLN